MPKYVAAIDQGTTSSRCILFDVSGPIAVAQKEHKQHYPRPGWVEHDPLEIWNNTREVVTVAMQRAAASSNDIAAIGITNQRETVVVWDRRTGQPLHNAIVWSDTRTADLCDRYAADGGQDRFRAATGLPLATYFSAPKLRWLFDNVPGLQQAAGAKTLMFGTIDAWLIWNLTGGPAGGAHVCDVTNASRTMLMDLRTLGWSDELLTAFDIPRSILPTIVPSVDHRTYGMTRRDGPFGGEIPVSGCLGDQQAALIGQTCFNPGESKNTYGTGCFMLLNTGTSPVVSKSGLLTTVAYRVDDQAAHYALEGSIAVAGSLAQWVRDALGLIRTSPEIETLAKSASKTTAAFISSPPSPDFSRRTGDPMPAASSPASPDTPIRATSPAPFSKRRPTKPAMSSTPCAKTPASRSRASAWMAEWRPTICLCSFRPTFSMCRWCGRRSSRQQRSARPMPPDWRLDFGRISRT